MPEEAARLAPFAPMLQSILLRWERLSVLYNLVLVGVVLFPTGGSFHLPEVRQLPALAVGGVLANLCYLGWWRPTLPGLA